MHPILHPQIQAGTKNCLLFQKWNKPLSQTQSGSSFDASFLFQKQNKLFEEQEPC